MIELSIRQDGDKIDYGSRDRGRPRSQAVSFKEAQVPGRGGQDVVAQTTCTLQRQAADMKP